MFDRVQIVLSFFVCEKLVSDAAKNVISQDYESLHLIAINLQTCSWRVGRGGGRLWPPRHLED